MALLPASGFQSAQYRFIELCATDMINLVAITNRGDLTKDSEMNKILEQLYWRSGATELKSGKKTLTLQQFEEKYAKDFLEMGVKYKDVNLRQIYLNKFKESREVIARLREFDSLANVLWPLAHMKSAARYLQKDPEDIKATGGTNWQKYLPPRFQKVMFFPELWSDQEKEEWGKAAVIKALGQ
jgi:tryptophan 2,3-dioxygenase